MVLFDATAEDSGYTIGDRVRLVTATDQARLDPELVGIADFEEGGTLNGATLAMFDTPTAQGLFLDGEDAYTDLWVTAEDGVSQEELRDAVAERCARRGRGGDRRRRRGRVRLGAVGGDLLPADVPADLRGDRPRGRRLPHRQHLLDPGRAAQPGARAAAGPGRLAQAGQPVGALRGLRARRARSDARPRARRAPRHGDPGVLRAVRARPVRPVARLRLAHGRRGLRHRSRGDHDRRVASRAQDRSDRSGAGAPRRRGIARVGHPPPVAGRDRADPARRHFDGAGTVRGRPARRMVRRSGRARCPARGVGRQSRDQPAVPGRRTGGVRAAFRHRRQPGWEELAAEPATDDGHRIGPDDRAGARLHHGDRRRLGQGERGRVGRGELRRRLCRERGPRAAILAGDRRRDGGGRGRRDGDPPAGQPRRAGRRQPVDQRGRPGADRGSQPLHDGRRGGRPRRPDDLRLRGLGRGPGPGRGRHRHLGDAERRGGVPGLGHLRGHPGRTVPGSPRSTPSRTPASSGPTTT